MPFDKLGFEEENASFLSGDGRRAEGGHPHALRASASASSDASQKKNLQLFTSDFFLGTVVLHRLQPCS